MNAGTQASQDKAAGPVGARSRGVRSLVATAKNEGPFLLEWVLYHRLIGFDNIVIFANDCEDGSDHLLTLLDQAGLIRYYENSGAVENTSGDPQNRAYIRALRMDHVLASDRVMVLDLDEFFNIHSGDGTLDALFGVIGDPDVISAQWVVYGNGGQIGFEDGLAMDHYTRCSPKDYRISADHSGLKSMFRPGLADRLGVHRPLLKEAYQDPEADLIWLNGSGKDVTDVLRIKGWSATRKVFGFDLCQINHYMIKSNELFLMKRYRGAANTGDQERLTFQYYDFFNTNHQTDTSLQRWSGPVRQAIMDLRAQHPQIAAAHDQCVGFFHGKIADLTDGLRASDPEAWDRLMNPETVAASVQQDEDWIKERRLEAYAEKAQKELDHWGMLPRGGFDAEDVIIDDGFTHAHPKPKRHTRDFAPNWLVDLRQSDHKRGFYYSETAFTAHFAERKQDVLIMSFEDAAGASGSVVGRESWGYAFFKSQGWSHLGVMSAGANWYRDAALFDYLEGLAAAGFFKKFNKVILTGVSMGGYGATAFASIVPGCTVLAFSPQSSLDGQLVPWEDRFDKARALDWAGRYRDGAAEVAAAAGVFLVYDPGVEQDRMHAARYQGPRVVHLKTWYSGHKSALFLRRSTLLQPLFQAAVSGELGPDLFYRAYRDRRKLPWYVNALTDKALGRGHERLLRRMINALRRQGRGKLARAISKRVDEH